jgi:LmbE family N-acetylglucosaminyl deacetylase
MSVLVISTHLDDGILSAGQFIAGHPSVTLLTVFAGIPDDGFVTDYDKSCGFETSKFAMQARRNEDREATAMLNATYIHANLLDSQYENEISEDVEKAIDWILNDVNYDFVVAPLGLRHPDHIAVADATLKLKPKNLYLYEDLPHRVTNPELVFDRFEQLKKQGFKPSQEFIGDGAIELKMRALMCYHSQMLKGDLNPYNLYVAERFWRI